MTSMTNSTMLTNMSSFPYNWDDLFQSDQPLDMDAFLQSDVFAAKRSAYMKQSIAYMISGSISFIASIMLVIHILRSHEYLTTTYHRLIFGLSAADIIASFCMALSSTMVPKEMSYLVPFASGSTATCAFQGFLIIYATGVSARYNISVCFYFLAIITYNKKHDYIRRKLEPWFHVISILFSLVGSLVGLVSNAYNGPNGGVCYADPHQPPHCIGYEAGDIPKGYSIPCGRGGPHDGQAQVLRTISRYEGVSWVLVISPVTILFTMLSMFRSVTDIEKRMENYGVKALRLRTKPLAMPTTTNTNSADQQRAIGFALRMVKKLGKLLCLKAPDASQTNRHRFQIISRCCFPCPPFAGDDSYDPERPSPRSTTKSNKMKTQKRAVLNMAFGYAGAWLLVWSSYFAFALTFLLTNTVSDTVNFLTACMLPLQGFFNFVVFMAPKVRTTREKAVRRRKKSSNNNNTHQDHQYFTWSKIFYEAYMSRGSPLEDRNLSKFSKRSTERRMSGAIVRRISGTFRTVLERITSRPSRRLQ